MGLPTSMDETFTLEGLWWLLDSPQNVITGRVYHEPYKPIVLSLVGIFGEENDQFDLNKKELVYRTIHGITTDGKPVSLIKSIQSVRTFNFPGIAVESYQCLWMIVGQHVDSLDAELFESSDVKFDHVDLWVGQPTLTMHQSKEPATITVTVEPYSEHPLGRVERLGVNVLSRMSTSFHDDRLKSFQVKIRHRLAMRCDELRSTEWHTNTLSELTSLAALCTGTHLEVDSIRLLTKERELAPGVKHPEEAYVFYHRIFAPSSRNNRGEEPPIYSAAELHGSNPNAISKWFDVRDQLRPVIDLLFSVMMPRQFPLEVAFLLVVQALEVFHRSTADDKVMSVEAFENIKALLSEAVPPETPADMRDKIRSYFEFGNEPSLRRRLKSAIEPLKAEFGATPFGMDRGTINAIVNSRNYYTHYSASLRESAARGRALHDLTEKMKPLVFTLLLQQLELPLQEIRANLARRSDMKIDWA